MKQYIDKDALVALIKKIYNEDYKFLPSDIVEGIQDFKDDVLRNIDDLEVKEVEEYKQPEYSCIETVYHCGKKPRWNLGDTLAYYEFYSDREGECVLGKVNKVEFDEEQCDWFYTFEDGSFCSEQLLLEEETYKKN